jgi:thioredoxin 1
MNHLGKALIVVILLIAVGFVVALKQSDRPRLTEPTIEDVSVASRPLSVVKDEDKASRTTDREPQTTDHGLRIKPPLKSTPRLLDLGADRCIPCRMMAPILEELKKEYAGKLQVQFIDVWKNHTAAQQHGVRVIPTQIFYDGSGKELFRHQGFMSKEDILAKWKELGVSFGN